MREAPGLRLLGFHFFLRFLAALLFLAPEDLWPAEATFPCWPDSLAAICWPAGLEEGDGIPLAISGIEVKVRIRIMTPSFFIFLDFPGPARGLGPARHAVSAASRWFPPPVAFSSPAIIRGFPWPVDQGDPDLPG